MNETHIRNVVEAALLAAGKPLQPAELVQLFDETARPQTADIQAALAALSAEYSSRGIEIKETAAGFRIQVRREMANEVSRLWPERPGKYSRALLETLALIAYRQPITRAEIEAVRGVAVNPNIIKTVIDRNWVRVVGTRDVPGRPELLGTTREFLDYFGLKNLDELPPLAELKTLGEIKVQFDLPDPATLGLAGDGSGTGGGNGEVAAAAPADAAASGVGGVASVGDGPVAGEGTTAVDGDGVGDGGVSEGDGAVSGEGAVVAADEDAAVAAGEDAAVAAGEGAVVAAGEDAAVAAGEGAAVAAGEGAAVAAGEGTAVAADEGAAVAAGEGAAVAAVEDAATAGGEGATGSAGADGVGTDGAGRDVAVAVSHGEPVKARASSAAETALHEAEEFAASIDADLAAGDDDSADDGSEDDELSAAGPTSSELVAGPREMDE